MRIACLPVAGGEDPGQLLLMEGLRANHNLIVFSGINDKFFGIIRTAFILKPDYIHFDWIDSYYYRRWLLLTIISIPVFILQVYICSFLLRRKIVWSIHNVYPHDKKYHTLIRFVYRLFCISVTKLRAFSKESIQRISQEYHVTEDKMVSVPQGSFVDYYPNSISKAEARLYLNIGSSNKVFLFLGSLRPYKGVDELITAFREINYSNALLIIAGRPHDKKYVNRIKTNLPSNIMVFDQFIPGERLQYYFNAADVVVLPFKKVENSGSIVLAMGFKKVIIAPDAGVISERLYAQKQYLYKSNELAKSISKALKISSDELQEIGEMNFLEVQKYSWESFSKCFIP